MILMRIDIGNFYITDYCKDNILHYDFDLGAISNDEIDKVVEKTLVDKDLILKVLSEIRHTKDCHVVIMMDENDMKEIVSKNYEEAIEYFKLIKKKKYEIALALKSSNLTWANGVYEVFDYFVIDKTLTSGKESLDSSSAIKRLSTKLTVFQKPLIALDMTTKAMIQILRERGFNIFGGNAIEMRSEDIVELTPRKMSVVRK